MSFVKIKHLTKYYTREEPVISNLNLEFPATGLNIVVGKSGCGKTTLLNVIGSMDNDYIGTVNVGGKVLSKMSDKQLSQYKNFTIGYIFQKEDLFEELTVEENLNIVLNMQSKKASIAEVLERVGLAGFEKRKIKYLSGGERQRVGIARVLIKDCAIILADEPTSALDSKNGHQIFKLLQDISKERLVIAVTHDTKKAFQYADRIIRFSDGNVVEDKLISDCPDKEIVDIYRKPKGTALAPVFKFQFTRGLFVNLFVTLLLALAMITLSVSAEQKIIYDEYQKYNEEGYTGVNVNRVISTQIKNNINLWSVAPKTTEESPYQYLSEVALIRGGLTGADLDILKNHTNGANININNNDVGKLVVKYASKSQPKDATISGVGSVAWHEDERTPFDYYLYDENNKYDIIGSLPKEDNEVLVTDTFADLYCRARSEDGSFVDGGYSIYYGTFNGDYTTLIGDTIIIKDIYYQIDTYYYTIDLEFRVTGIINTGQLDYYYYREGDYYFTSKIEQQTGKATYMNSAHNQPYGYIVTKVDLDALRTNPYLFKTLNLVNVNTLNVNLNGNVKAFVGTDDYRVRGYNDPTYGYYSIYYVDNLQKDRNERIIVKSTTNANLQDNEVLLTVSALKQIAPNVDITDDDAVTNYFNNNLKDKVIKMSFETINNSNEIDCKVVGITKDNDGISMYISDSMYQELFADNQAEINYGVTLDISKLNLKQRKKLMENLYDLGYVMSPIDVMPGAYSEFIPEASIATITDSIGESEEGNISLYNMYSEYYNTDSVKSMNNFLRILDSISIFTLIMALVVSIGCIYLNERKHRVYIVKMCILGVRPRKIIAMQLITYLLMAVIVFGLTYLGTFLFSLLANSAMTLNFQVINAQGVADGSFNVYRIRMILTNNTLKFAALGTLITALIGLVCTSIAVKQFKK